LCGLRRGGMLRGRLLGSWEVDSSPLLLNFFLLTQETKRNLGEGRGDEGQRSFGLMPPQATSPTALILDPSPTEWEKDLA
jgi:hypothetical protein